MKHKKCFFQHRLLVRHEHQHQHRESTSSAPVDQSAQLPLYESLEPLPNGRSRVRDPARIVLAARSSSGSVTRIVVTVIVTCARRGSALQPVLEPTPRPENPSVSTTASSTSTSTFVASVCLCVSASGSSVVAYYTLLKGRTSEPPEARRPGEVRVGLVHLCGTKV